ncbi:hypothetical protein CMESO_220 (nucleomorph) [Chroomonas mesostigmatica CCMP1168]|uniref:Uncharacterized protein n=1 Tax=Chroomonas mesostigmatica CCMP1168 TaxID=1195612 RepID=J7G7W5_9CRYP|nr:hypothetical protein CMESO_220 [Chroomonas mesostigmatica CCMP1168]
MFFPFLIIAHKKVYCWKKAIFFKNYFSTISFDNILRIWNQTFTRTKLKRCVGHKKNIVDLCGTKKLQVLISASNDKTIKFWDFLSNRLLRTRKINFDTVFRINLNYFFQKLICIGNKSITIWNISNGSCVCFLLVPTLPNFSYNKIFGSKIFFFFEKCYFFSLFYLKRELHTKTINFFSSCNSFFYFAFFSKNCFFFIGIDNFRNLLKINQFNYENFRKTFVCLLEKKPKNSPLLYKNFNLLYLIFKNYSIIWDQNTGLIVNKNFKKINI